MIETLNLNSTKNMITYGQYVIYLKEIIKKYSNNIEDNNNEDYLKKLIEIQNEENNVNINRSKKNIIVKNEDDYLINETVIYLMMIKRIILTMKINLL